MPQKPARSASAKKALPFWVLYAALAFLAFSPCLLLNRAYFDNDLLAQFGPWRFFLKDQLAQGHFPLWNPYLLGGQPFFADLQNMMFYPFNYLTLPFSVPYGLGVFFFLHAFWSACGMHLWLRSLNLSSNACRVGAILFAFSNFFWLEIIHPPVIAAFAWLPWLFASVENLSQNPKPRNAFYAGLAFAMLFLCGSFQITVGALYAAAFYFLFSQLKNRPLKSFSNKSRFSLALFILWGLLPLFGQLIPTLEFSALTERRTPNQSYEEFNGNLALKPATLYQLILPRISLRKDQTIDEALLDTHGDPKSPPTLVGNLGYLGVFLPFLIFLAYQDKEKKSVYFLSGLGLFSLLLCFGKFTPLHRWVCDLLPGFSLIRVPFRFIYLYVLATAALAAFGFAAWETAMKKADNRRKVLITGSIYLFLAYLAALINPAQTWAELVSLALGAAALALAAWKPSQIKKASRLLAASLVLPLFLTGLTDFKTAPASNFDYEKNSFSLSQIQKQMGPFRVVFDNAHMAYPINHEGRMDVEVYPQNASCVLGLKDNGGYNPLILNSKKDLQDLPLTALIHIGAVGGIVSGVDHGPIPGFYLKSLPPFFLHQTNQPPLYVFAPGSVEVVEDRENRLKKLKNPGYDPYQLTLLSEPLPPTAAGTLSAQKIQLRYQIQQDGPSEQKYQVEADHNCVAVFAETMFPGWKAFVDGQPSPLFTADHVLRALYLPAGPHRVEFKYEPFWWRPIQAGSALWLLITLGFLLKTKSASGKNHA